MRTLKARFTVNVSFIYFKKKEAKFTQFDGKANNLTNSNLDTS